MSPQYFAFPQYVAGIPLSISTKPPPSFKNNTEIFTSCNVSDKIFPSGILFELNSIEVPKGSISEDRCLLLKKLPS